jgi:ParB family transcriptional regulator, chromosome partitioning protein
MSNGLTFVPLNKLVRSSLNVRKTGADSIDDLAASIAVHGLLQNLTVTKKSATGKTKSKADAYEVVAGGRRLAALQSLAKQQKIPKDTRSYEPTLQASRLGKSLGRERARRRATGQSRLRAL